MDPIKQKQEVQEAVKKYTAKIKENEVAKVAYLKTITERKRKEREEKERNRLKKSTSYL